MVCDLERGSTVTAPSRSRGGPGRYVALVMAMAIVSFGGLVSASPGRASGIPPEIVAALTPQQLTAYQNYLRVRGAFDRQLEMYWALVEERRGNRRKKYQMRLAFDVSDYVTEQPPKYTGPPMPADVQAIIDRVRPRQPPTELPSVADFLESARTVYGFQPTRTTEKQFKRSYAIEALAAGLTRDQVVRVYALETGGRGTFDMQAGIDPDTKKGRPISSALGYAQLLHANSISELVKHGDSFIQRLHAMAQRADVPGAQRIALLGKANVLRKMLTQARKVPNEWSAHQALAKTSVGLGIHALNLDADIGPWLQVLKLRGLLDTARREAGRTTLTGAELELMNLAGPRTGLEMMQPIGRTMPTANFFSQQGYYRNTIVREKNGAQLLQAIEERMEAGLKKPGSIEFLQAFDEVEAGGARVTPRPRSQEPREPTFGPHTVFR